MSAIRTTVTGNRVRHQVINSVMAQCTEVDAAIKLWEQMATQIVALVGEDGFNSLYARSVFLSQSTFPCLAAGSPSPQTDHRLANLKTSLEGQTAVQVVEACGLLLITFTDTLASLIGEQLTARILQTAWGIDAFFDNQEHNVMDSAGNFLSEHQRDLKDE